MVHTAAWVLAAFRGVLRSLRSGAPGALRAASVAKGSGVAVRASGVAGVMVLLAALAAGPAWGASSGQAQATSEETCTLTLEGAEVLQVYSTRALMVARGESASTTVHYVFEYREKGSSKWEEAGNGTSETNDVEDNIGAYALDSPTVQHLRPETDYEGLAVIENGCTIAREIFEFKTTPASAPEIPELRPNLKEGEVRTEIGLGYADYEAEIESNDVETQYQFEIEKEGEGAWKAATGTGTSGTVTAAEDHAWAKAHISGLTPETSYVVRVVATSAKGSGNASAAFTTASHHPSTYTGGVSEVGASSAHLEGTIIPRTSETHWQFEYATSETGPWIVGPSGVIGIAEAGEGYNPVEGEVMGLQRGTVYYVRLHAENGSPPAVTSQPFSFETAGAPVVITFATHTYIPGGETVRILGSVQPHGFDTHYHFQYVAQEDFAANEWTSATSTTEQDAGPGTRESGFPVKIVGEDLPGLLPGKTYHYRLVASSAEGTVDGGGQTITVPVPAPREEAACPEQPLRNGPSARLPDCRAYELVTPAEKNGAMDNWIYSGNISSPVAVGEDGEHVVVKAQFSRWGTNVDPDNNSYFFTRTSAGWRMTSATQQPQDGDSSHQPSLFNADLTQTALSVGWGTTLLNHSSNVEMDMGAPGGPYTVVASEPRSSEPKWVAASSDFGTLILSRGAHLYEWSGGELSELDKCPAMIGEEQHGFGGAPGGGVSEYGVHVFFEGASGAGCSGESNLYMRVDHSTTEDLGAYKLLAANAQGTRLLVQRQSGETYEYLLYDVESKTSKLLFSTHGTGVLIASKGLSVIYFETKEQLTPEAPPLSPGSEDAALDPENLYRYDIGEAKLTFIAQTLSGSSYVGGEGRYYYWASGGVAGVFQEVNHQFEIPGGHAVEPQVYRYDSVENVVQCMSCVSSFDSHPQLASLFLGGDIEDATDGVPNPMIASENGDYVFFDTPSPLVPQDIDGELYAGTHNLFTEEHDFSFSPSSDVYEWRKNGIDGCSHVQGCLALISSGTGGLKNILLGTTPSGNDVFFATHSQLVPQDTDGQGDVYDARIGGGFPPSPARPVECEADACSTPPNPPNDATPSSLTFSGVGDLPPRATPTPAVKDNKLKKNSGRRRRKKRKARRAGGRRRSIKQSTRRSER
jgi:hypothetical protein